ISAFQLRCAQQSIHRWRCLFRSLASGFRDAALQGGRMKSVLRRRSLVVGLVTLAFAAEFARQKPMAFYGGKLLTVSHGVIDHVVLVMQNGKITALGAQVSIPKDARVIDVT